MAKWAREVALLEQEHVRSDRYEGKTIEELRADLAARTGENVQIARFARFVVGQD
jgi:elongation factor Ts